MDKPVQIIYASPENLYRVSGLGYDCKIVNQTYDNNGNPEYPEDEIWHHQPNTNYLVIGEYCHSVISSQISLGLRGAQFWMIAMMKRVGLQDGSNYIFTYEDDESIKAAIKKLEDPDMEKIDPRINPNIPIEIVTDADRACELLQEFIDKKPGTFFGLDYESKHFPDNHDFIITGAGIASVEKAFWIDFRFIATVARASLCDYPDPERNHHYQDEGLMKVLTKLFEFYDKHSRFTIVFNVNFELQASYRYGGKFWEFRDLNCTNIMKQYGTWCNLKWTIRYLSNVLSWDDKFEEFNSALEQDDDHILADWDEDGNIVAFHFDKLRERFTWLSLTDCQEMEKWRKICGNSYYVMPSRHLGYYCCLDAYYTLIGWIIEVESGNWNYVADPEGNHGDMGERMDKCPRMPPDARWEIMAEAGLDAYCDGKIAESIVNNGGQLVDIKFWTRARNLSYAVMVKTTVNLAVWWWKTEIEKYEGKVNNLEDYNEITRKLIDLGFDITQDPFYLAKDIFLNRYYDKDSDGCCNMDLLYEDWGQETADEMWGWVGEYSWNYEGNYATLENTSRKRTMWQEIGNIVGEKLAIPQELLDKHAATMEYQQLLRNIDWFSKSPWFDTSFEDISHEWEWTYDGRTMDLKEWYDELAGTFNTNTMQGTLFYRDVYERNFDMARYLLMRRYGFCEGLEEHYTGDVFKDCEFFYSDEAEEFMTEEDINNIQKYIWEFDTADDEDAAWYFDHLELCWDPKGTTGLLQKILDLMQSDNPMSDPKYEFWVVMIMIRLFAKYFKIKSYVHGTPWYDRNINYHRLDDYWMHDFDDYSNEPYDEYHNVIAMPIFEANKQFSGRWSSGFHTIPSHGGDIKKCTTSPEDSVFTYFDISAMEVRTIAYLSQDPGIVDLYEQKVDVYKYCARFMLGAEYWDSLDEETKGEYRGDFKVVLLAYFYLRGARSLAPELKKSVEETQAIMDSLGRTFPKAIEFRDYLRYYPFNNPEGRIMTVFKEWIVSDEEPYRMEKHGINTVIQGCSAIMLVYGFFNLQLQTWKLGWKFRSIGYVHDSSQSYFDIRHLWEMYDHYHKHVTDFLYDRFRIRFEFDIMLGTNYEEVGKLSQIDPDTIQIKGCANCINSILDRLEKNNLPYEVLDTDKLYDEDCETGWDAETGRLENWIMPWMQDFLGGNPNPYFERDQTNYKVKIKKLF